MTNNDDYKLENVLDNILDDHLYKAWEELGAARIDLDLSSRANKVLYNAIDSLKDVIRKLEKL